MNLPDGLKSSCTLPATTWGRIEELQREGGVPELDRLWALVTTTSEDVRAVLRQVGVPRGTTPI